MIREAVAATQAAARTGLPVWVSFTLNASNALISGETLTHAVSPTQYAQAAHEWREIGASIIGGCCGTTPAHVEKLSHHHRQKDDVLTRAQHQ